MIKRFVPPATILLSALFFLFSGITAADDTAADMAVNDPAGAIAFIETVAADTKTVWSDATLADADRAAAFRQIFEKAADIELLAKGMLGRHYKTASPAQRTGYMDAMTVFIIGEFDKRMQQIGFKDVEILGTTPASGKNGHLFVRTKVDRENGAPILADWRVRKKGGEFRIVNLEVEGINLVITNREQFSARIAEIGLDGLIDELKSTYAAPVAAASSASGTASEAASGKR